MEVGIKNFGENLIKQ